MSGGKLGENHIDNLMAADDSRTSLIALNVKQYPFGQFPFDIIVVAYGEVVFEESFGVAAPPH